MINRSRNKFELYLYTVKQVLIIVLFSFFCTLSFGQSKIFNNWHFGEHASISFNTDPPTALYGSLINSVESCASISDDNGVLLFYTDGIYVYNKNHVIMPNGFGLLGHNSSTQGAFIVPYPKHPNLYYLFTTDAEGFGVFGGCDCLSYSIIDMSLSGGLGDVTAKNTFLYSSITEKMTGYFVNDTTTWLVAHEFGSNKFLSFKITQAGIITTPIVSAVGSTHCCYSSNTRGQMKLSKDGTKLGYCIILNGKVELLNFNKSLGILSNPVSFILQYPNPYGFEFSPNCNYIYLSTDFYHNSRILQFDITSWDSLIIKNSQKEIYNNSNNATEYGQLQLGPDDKIYISETWEQKLSLISNPNLLGVACNFTNRSVWTNNQALLGLPNIIWGYYKQPENLTVDTLCEPLIPNIITPNNDQVNDDFKITCNNRVFIPFDLVIYNRWGKQVYNQIKKTNLLDDCPDGTYFYIFSLNEINYKGYLSVFH